MIELYRAVIPSDKVINDNHGAHYRVHQANLDWLTNQFNEIMNGEKVVITGRGRGVKRTIEKCTGPCGFIIPNKEKIKEYIGVDKDSNEQEYNLISIRCEVWKPRNIRFDPQNYCKTFKAPIDLLVHNEYIEDDNWKFVDGITYCGGGPEVWTKRLKICELNGPNGLKNDSFDLNWWKENISEDYNDILIRILVEKSNL